MTPFLDGLSSKTSLKSNIVPCWAWRFIQVTESTLSPLASLVGYTVLHFPENIELTALFLWSMDSCSMILFSYVVCETGPCTQPSQSLADMILLLPCRTPDHRFPSWLLYLAVPYPGHSLAYSRGTLSHKPQLRGIGTFPLCGVLVYHS